MARKRSRRRNTTRRRRRYPSRSVSKRKSAKTKIKWKKTKMAAATLATIAVAFGLYKWRKGRQIPDLNGAKNVLKKTTENSNIKSNVSTVRNSTAPFYGPPNAPTQGYYVDASGHARKSWKSDRKATSKAVLAGVKSRKAQQQQQSSKRFSRSHNRFDVFD